MPSQSIRVYAANKAGGANADAATVGALMCSAYDKTSNTIGVGVLVGLQDTGNVLYHFYNTVWMVLLAICVMAFLYKVMKAAIVPMTRVFAVMVLSPVILLLATVPPFRRAVLTTLKILMEAWMQLILVFGTVGVITALMAQAAGIGVAVPPGQNATIVNSDAASWGGSASYFTALLAIVVCFLAFDPIIGVAAAIMEVIVGNSRMAMQQIFSRK